MQSLGRRTALVFVLGAASGALAARGLLASEASVEASVTEPSAGGEVRLSVPRPAAHDGAESEARSPSPAAPLATRPEPTARHRFVAIGGGVDPASTQVQLEQDVALFWQAAGTETPGNQVWTLFAGGPETRAVQVLDHAEPLRIRPLGQLASEVGALLDPRPERLASYRAPLGEVHGAADAGAVLETLAAQLRHEGPRLDVFVAAHGEAAELPADTLVALWGETSVSVHELSEVLQAPDVRRPLRLILTSCYGGGFAELIFQDADAARGTASALHCGVFATSAEHESSGCDANPDRREQEGYALHALSALRGLDREGRPRAGLDLDGDGAIGLLEAHTYARIASRSIDLPTTTSERYLRSLGLEDATQVAEVSTPEEDAVVAALSAELGVASEDAVFARMVAIEQLAEALALRIDGASTAEDEARQVAVLEIVSRWPELSDPYRADFMPTLEAHSDAIRAILRSPSVRAYQARRVQTDALLLEEDALRLQWVRASRLMRALRTKRLAGALAAAYPPGHALRERYDALLRCERAPLGVE